MYGFILKNLYATLRNAQCEMHDPLIIIIKIWEMDEK